MVVDLGAGPVGRGVALVLAGNPVPPADKGPEFGKASPVGLVVILLLLLATIFLVRSMSKHLRRVPESFDDRTAPAGTATPGDPARSAPDDGSAGAAADAAAPRAAERPVGSPGVDPPAER